MEDISNISNKDKLLFIIALLLSGIAWALIPSQIEGIPIDNSVAYRFFIASTLLGFSVFLFKKQKLTFNWREQFLLFFQGTMMYSIFCALTYRAVLYIPSGAVSLVSALIVIPNTIFAVIFLKERFKKLFILNASIAILGIVLFYFYDIKNISLSNDFLKGIFLSLAGIFLYGFASTLVSKNKTTNNGITFKTCVSMLYGACFSILISLLTGEGVTFLNEPHYYISLLALGTMAAIVFLIYNHLIQSIGPARAGLLWLGVPVIALILSSVFEDFHWDLPKILGSTLIIKSIYRISAKNKKKKKQ
jgi:drug/metabolite transporter (DMT)-like permease